MALTKEDVELLRGMMREEIAASENRMMAYMENTIEKKIDLLAEGQMALGERMDRMQAELDDVHSSVLANEIYIANCNNKLSIQLVRGLLFEEDPAQLRREP